MSSVFVNLFNVIFTFSICIPAYSLELGLKGNELEEQKLRQLLKADSQNYPQKKIGQPSTVSDQGKNYQRPLNLDLPEGYVDIEYVKEVAEKSLVKAQDYQSYLDNLLKEEISVGFNYDHLPRKQREVATAIRNFAGIGFAMFSVLWALPEDLTKWDKDREASQILDKWEENVKAGPVVDEDSAFVNYIGHPYSGAFYYMTLRDKGFSKMESFGFAVFASTFLWEYGIESFAEIPSIQDLILTPIAGAILGEKFIKWDKKLAANDYRLLNSKKIGAVAHFLLKPNDAINRGIDRFFGIRFLHLDKARFYVRNSNFTKDLSGGEEDIFRDESTHVGLKFEFVVW